MSVSLVVGWWVVNQSQSGGGVVSSQSQSGASSGK
jgi:hypothetical protein